MSDSIFKSGTINLKNVFTDCQPTEVLYAPIDVAKYNHSAMIVNFVIA